jgi:hypothetical protein
MITKKHIVIGVAIVFVIVLTTFQGCTAKSISPFSGKEVTAEQLAAEAKVEEVRLAKEATTTKVEADRKLAEVQAAQRKAKSIFDRAVAKIQDDAKSQINVIAGEYEQNTLEVDRLTAQIVSETTAKMAELDAQRASNIEAAKATLAEIEAKQAKYETILSVGQTIAAGLGPYGGIAAGAIGLAGVLFGVSKRKDAQAAHENAGRIIDAIDLLKDRKPEVAQAFKSEAEFLKSWMGDKAVEYVEKVQKS